MQASEAFSKIKERLITGIMFHADMADYFDFLNLRGFKRMHEYHFFAESAEMRELDCYYIEHFNALLPFAHPAKVAIIPEYWHSHTRAEVSSDAKRRAVRDGMVKWTEWEKGTKALYEQCCADLYGVGEIAAALEVKDLVRGVDHELKHAERMALTLEGVSYDMSVITSMQSELHDKYEGKIKRG